MAGRRRCFTTGSAVASVHGRGPIQAVRVTLTPAATRSTLDWNECLGGPVQIERRSAKIVSAAIAAAELRKSERILDEPQDAGGLETRVHDRTATGIWRDDEHRNSKTQSFSIDHWRRYVVVPSPKPLHRITTALELQNWLSPTALTTEATERHRRTGRRKRSGKIGVGERRRYPRNRCQLPRTDVSNKRRRRRRSAAPP